MMAEDKIKSFDELTFTDNFIFTNVLEAHPDLCIDLVELVTGRKVDHMKQETLGSEHTVEQTPDAKGVRLDVYFEDSDTMYDLEMQTTKEADLPKRFRYYQGMMDLAALNKGKDYGELQKSIIVFLCTFDAFGAGEVKYEFQNLCVSDPSLALGDETTKIAVCAFGKTSEENEKLNALLSYMQDRTVEDPLIARLDEAVQTAKKSAEMRRQYMSYEMDRLRYGKQEKEKGIEEGRLSQLVDLVRDGTLDISGASSKAGMSETQFQALLNQ